MTVEPGIYKGISFEEYKSWDAANMSHLIWLHTHTPLHYKYWAEHERPDTQAFKDGRRIHCRVLEPELFKTEYRESPQSATIAEQVALADKTLGALRKGWSEVSLAWVDPDTGILCKGRLDHLSGKAIIDLKSTRDSRKFQFSKDVYTYNYHIRAAFYLNGLSVLMGETITTFLIYAVEKAPPYACKAWRLPERAIRLGEAACAGMLAQLKECREKDVWPGYGEGVEAIDLPSWAYPEGFDFLNK